uniref:Uncharacterized protein n=1 Tax=Rhizophora mucronata TaxID=61149 RepID=A0A2P2JP79_RHIMU
MIKGNTNLIASRQRVQWKRITIHNDQKVKASKTEKVTTTFGKFKLINLIKRVRAKLSRKQIYQKV